MASINATTRNNITSVETEEVSKISNTELKAMEQNSVKNLPSSPVDSGLKASAVQPKFYQFALGSKNSLFASFNERMEIINSNLDLLKGKLNDDVIITINNCLSDISSVITFINTNFNNLDNTSDVNKPISTATQTALNLKQNNTITFKSESKTIENILSALDSSISSIETSISNINSSITTINNTNSTQSGRLDTLTTNVNTINGQITTINSLLNGDDTDLDSIKEIADSLKALGTALETQTNINDSLSGIATTYSSSKINALLGGKANSSHTHTKSEITDFAHTHTASDVGAYTKAETEALDNKSKYLLGAYDSVSGNVITRQTGYVYLKDIINYDNCNSRTCGNGYEFGGDTNAISLIPNYGGEFITDSILTQGDAWSFSNTITLVAGLTNIWINIAGLTTKEEFVSWLNSHNVCINYKLATSYTEPRLDYSELGVYANETLKIAKDQAQLFNKSNVSQGFINGATGTLTSDTSWIYQYINVNGNSTYTLSGATAQITRNYHIAYFNGNAFISGIYGSTPTITFITPANCTKVSISSPKDNLNILMLNEGAMPLPYQEYKGKVVHESELTPYAKSSDLSSYQLKSNALTIENHETGCLADILSYSQLYSYIENSKYATIQIYWQQIGVKFVGVYTGFKNDDGAFTFIGSSSNDAYGIARLRILPTRINLRSTDIDDVELPTTFGFTGMDDYIYLRVIK